MKVYAALYPNNGAIPIEGEEEVVLSPNDLSTSDGVLIIWGGEDITPAFYGERPGSRTGARETPSQRDSLEWALAKRAVEIGLPILGICRGAQMMCAMSGGKLVQHVSGHANGGHDLITDTGKTIRTNSLHHQMMFPWDVEHKLIAWSSKQRSSVYLGEDDRPIERASTMPEPEVVYFPTTGALAIQGHPEFIRDPKDPFVHYSMELIDGYLKA